MLKLYNTLTEKFEFDYSYGGHEKTGEPYCAIYTSYNFPTDLNR